MTLESRKITLAQMILNLQKEDLVAQFEAFAASFETSGLEVEIPQWQKDETKRRVKLLQNSPANFSDFDQAVKDIEKEL